MDYYSSQSACRIMGITLRQLRHWVDSDVIRPIRVDETGGQKRYFFDFRNLLEISLVLSLKQRSLSLLQCKKAVEVFNRELKSAGSFSHLTLFSDGETFFALSCHADAAFDVLRRGKTIFAIPIDELALELSNKMDIEEKDTASLLFRQNKDSNYVLIKFKF